MSRPAGLVIAALAAFLFSVACNDSGGRTVNITQTDNGCTPSTIDVTPGEKLRFVVKNDSSNDVYEVEGIEGTKLEEFVVPGGRTRKAGFTVPNAVGVYKLKCYVPSGPSTIIVLTAGGAAATPATDATEAPSATPGNSATP